MDSEYQLSDGEPIWLLSERGFKLHVNFQKRTSVNKCSYLEFMKSYLAL